MRAEGISPRKLLKTITDKIVLANVITTEMKSIYKNSKAVVSNILSSHNLQKYRLQRTLRLKTGIRRHSLKRRNEDMLKKDDRSRNKRKVTFLLTDMQAFFERDDNSRKMLGKNDKIKVGIEHVQKRILNDSLIYLHLKYKVEKSSNV